MNNLKLFMGLFLLFLIGQAQAQNAPQSLSLNESVNFALQNSPLVKNAQLDVDKNAALIKETISTGLPQVSASGQYLYNLKLATQLIPNFFGGNTEELIPVQFGTKMNTVFTGEVRQLVFSKTFFIGLEAARTSRNLYSLQVELTEQELAYQIAQLYYSIQVSQKQSDVLQANLDQITRLLSLTQKQFNNGLAKKIDVDQLQVSRINLENQIANLDLQVEQLKQALKFNMAMPLDQPIVLTDTLDESAYAIPDMQALAPDFSQKKDLAILEVQANLNKLNIENYKSGYWPTVNAFANYNYQAQGNTFNDLAWFDYGSIGLTVNVPIFDGFRKKAQIQQATIDQAKLAESTRLTKQSLALAYNQAMQQLQTNINNLRALSENRRVAEEVYRVSQSRFTEGIAPITEVLTSETAMREAQTNYLTALLQVKLAEIEVQNSKGTLLTTISNN